MSKGEINSSSGKYNCHAEREKSNIRLCQLYPNKILSQGRRGFEQNTLLATTKNLRKIVFQEGGCVQVLFIPKSSKTIRKKVHI